MSICALVAIFLLSITASHADSVGKKAADNSPEAEMAAFKLHPDFEINLFADESMGIANPIAMHWDHRGRLWVLTTLTYAQLKPGQSVDDKLIILEDTDHDGVADKSTVFADGLDMPMGFALGYGGVYVGEGPDLLFLKDTDNDDQADTRDVVYTGFGTGDTHQNISNFTWGPDGCLYFAQGLHCFSRIETPWGIVRGDEAGFWRFHPQTLRLEPFCFPSMATQNPCGIAFDRDGAMFIKSNNKELVFVTPGLIPTTHQKNLVPIASIGATPGKSMGAEYVESSHLPDWIQNHILVAGYYSNRVTAFPLVKEGAGFAKVDPVELMVSEHGSFRPVETRIGPDGAIYIADWFNPIIGHYQASLRHPDRDKKHGRVWRMTAKGRELNDPEIRIENVDAALLSLNSEEALVRYLALRKIYEKIGEGGNLGELKEKLVLACGTMDSEERRKAVRKFKACLGPLSQLSQGESFLLHSELNLLVDDPMDQMGWIARMIGVGEFDFENVNSVLELTSQSGDPSIRLESVVACANLADAGALPMALQALDHPRDRFIDHALEQTVHALAPHWVPAAKAGTLEFSKPEHLAYALEIYGGDDSREIAKQKLSEATLSPDVRARFTRVLAKMGNPDEIRDLLLSDDLDAATLRGLIEAWSTRKQRPSPPFVPRLTELIASSELEIRNTAIELAGLWKVGPLAGPIRKMAEDPNLPVPTRNAAMMAVSGIQGDAAIPFLKTIAGSDPPAKLGAITSLAGSPGGLDVAAELAVGPLSSGGEMKWLQPFLGRKGGTKALAAKLEALDAALSKSSASSIAMEMGRIGRSDPELMTVLNRAKGVQTGAPEYSLEKVKAIVASVEEGGNPTAGKEIFHRAELTCVACHQIEKMGGILGPSLDTVGAGLPLDLIVESVLWPDRQLKEGYFALSVTTKTGETFMGYSEGERSGTMLLRDTASGMVQTVPLGQIAERKNVGTLMPAGLTNSLKPEELRDLVAYLASLRG